MLHVVGIGADGWDALPQPTRDLVGSAEVVLGAPRQLELLPDIAGQRRVLWPSPLRERLPGLLDELADRAPVVALASGDPLVAGIGTTLLDLFGRESVIVVPTVSSVALARARLGWPAETVEVVRDPGTVVRHLAPGRRILVLSQDRHTPAQVSRALTEHGFGASRFTVLADLGGADESVRQVNASNWVGDAPALHVLAIECAGGPGHGLLAGLPDDAFEHDGQLTKRDLRTAALSRLAPQPGQLLWDVGAGAGSVAIEWMRAHATCRAVAVERDPSRAARARANAGRLGVPSLAVVTGAAPSALAGLSTPDAVFVGGGATPEVLDTCWSALPAGGRLVAHGVTVETEALLAAAYGERGGELTRIAVEHAAPLGGRTGWTPARTVTQWAVTK
jgi:precorrin-6Y C5,15-methyltransferase (decarboxylating)